MSKSAATKNFGLALSGGGFRATLFHLGLVRFLYDAGILPNITHITSVSGGSIIAAHLALNWNRYNGSANDFDEAASELLDFIRLDVRNGVLRRYPLAIPIRGLRRLAGLSNRKLTRGGLLEHYYEKYLLGDTSLFQLPEQPQLHILATNLSEGRLCSFNRNGLWTIHQGRHQFRINQVPIGLATVPMAVAASSAFPGFFPPIVLTPGDVGAKSGEFNRQAYTDGGIFDNLGVRMFHCIRQSLGKSSHPWEGVLVSDAGRPFEVQIQSSLRAGGLMRTAMRASNVLMDRVWQLESETFRDTTGFLFARITDMIDLEDDPTALHPEVQRLLPTIRTDLDRFSDVEISSLMQHGYCVGRRACRSRPDLFGAKLPSKPLWDPKLDIAKPTTTTDEAASSALSKREPKAVALRAHTLHASTTRGIWRMLMDSRDWALQVVQSANPLAKYQIGVRREPISITSLARTLHASAGHRIWSTLLDYRDWVAYIYVPIIVPLLILAPYVAVKAYERSHRINQIIESLAQESRDLEQMTRLLDDTPTFFVGEKALDMPVEEKADLAGYTILQDLRIIDLRHWNPTEGDTNAESFVYGYRRLKVRKGETRSSDFRVNVLALSPKTQVHFPAQQLEPKLYSRALNTSAGAEGFRRWQVGASFQKVPLGEAVDIVYEHLSPGLFLRRGASSTSLEFEVEAETVELSRWLLMPTGREYRSFRLVRYPTERPGTIEQVTPTTEFRSDDFTILAFKLLALNKGYTYELSWSYE